MIAKLTPPGGAPKTVRTTGEKWTINERGGLVSLTFDADLTASERAELGYWTAVEMPRPGAPPLLARVLDVSPTTITCGGIQVALDNRLGGACYSATALSDWKGRVGSLTNSGITLEIRPTLAMLYKDATVAGTNAITLELPEPTDKVGVTFLYGRESVAHSGFQFLTGVPNPSNTVEPWTWTLRSTSYLGQGVITGTYDSGLLTVSGVGAIMLLGGSDATGAVDCVSFANIRVYGTAAAATPQGVMGDVYAKIAADVPLTDVAAITTDLAQCTFPRTAKLAERVTDILDRGDWLARIEARSDGAGYKACGVFEARPTTADHVLHHDGVSVVAALESLDWAAMCSAVRVTYRTIAGTEAHVDVTDTDATHPLVAAGVTKWATIAVATTSATEATEAGVAYIALKNSGIKGTVRADGRHDFTEGHLVTVTGTPLGSPTARVRQIDGTAAGVVLTLDDTRTWDDWLARRY